MSRWQNIGEVYIPPVANSGFSENVMIRKKKELMKETAPVQPKAEPEYNSEATTLLEFKQVIQVGILRTRTNEKMLIEKDEVVIGKEVGNVDFLIDDNSAVSRRHASIRKSDNGYCLFDLNSLNHTFVDEQPITEPVPLMKDMKFRIADEEFVFLVESNMK